MSRPVTVSDEQIGKALRDSGGVIAHAAEAVGLSRRGITKRIQGNADLEAARDEGRAEILDHGETGLFTAVRAGKPWAIRFVLTRLGRDRGYGATLAVDSQVTGRVVVYLPDDGREESSVAIRKSCPSARGDGLQSL